MLTKMILGCLLALLLASGCAVAAPATVTNTSETFNCPQGLLPGYFKGSRKGDCRYPYQRFAGSGDHTQISHSWNKVVLENDWLRLDVIPEVGGHWLRFVNKVTGSNQFYEPLEPNTWITNAGGRIGTLLMGGHEFMFPLDEHHGPYYLPWDDKPAPVDPGKTWLTEDLADRVRLTMVFDEDTPELYNAADSRYRVTMVIELPDDRAACDVTMTVKNKSSSSHRLQAWSNSLCAPGPGSMDLFPPHQNINQHMILPRTVTSVFDHNNNAAKGPGTNTIWELLGWPLHNGQNISRYDTFIREDYGYCGVFVPCNRSAPVTFAGFYNLDANEGIMKTFPSTLKGLPTGVKIFFRGTDLPGWQKTFMELMTGVGTVFQEPVDCNFSSHPTGCSFDTWMSPGEELSWTETYSCPHSIGDAVHATEDAVVNLAVESSNITCGDHVDVRMGVYTFHRSKSARITLKVGNAPIYHHSGKMGPGAAPDAGPFHQDSSILFSGIPTGDQNLTLVFEGDNSQVVSHSIPVNISGNCGATNTPIDTPTNTLTHTPTGTPTGPTHTSTPTITATNTQTSTSTPLPCRHTECFERMPEWSSTWAVGWGGDASWSIISDGQTSNGLSARQPTGSAMRVKHHPIAQNSEYTLSVYMRCPTGSGSEYWMETGCKLGAQTAQDFDENPDTWTLIQKFDSVSWPENPDGNGNTWTQYTLSNVSTSNNTTISVGYKAGSSGMSPTFAWDSFDLTQQGAATDTH